ncbi:hypothetical protein [Leifsonia sp. Root112D2]|nr:hypothetical protein [Leifsonia sp. Root112D2]
MADEIARVDDWTVLNASGARIGQLAHHPDHYLKAVFARRHQELMRFLV